MTKDVTSNQPQDDPRYYAKILNSRDLITKGLNNNVLYQGQDRIAVLKTAYFDATKDIPDPNNTSWKIIDGNTLIKDLTRYISVAQVKNNTQAVTTARNLLTNVINTLKQQDLVTDINNDSLIYINTKTNVPLDVTPEELSNTISAYKDYLQAEFIKQRESLI